MKQAHVSALQSCTCDICKKKYTRENEIFEFQEMVCIQFDAGYGSVFGDMSRVELDMCQHCFKKKLGDHIKITEFDWKG